jgi:ribosomal protein L7/L12
MDDSTLLTRLRLIEDQLEILSRQAGMEYTRPGSSLPPSVRDLKLAGQTIQAIQELRRLTGVSLIEAKEAVENG